jgi:hypothetical protein
LFQSFGKHDVEESEIVSHNEGYDNNSQGEPSSLFTSRPFDESDLADRVFDVVKKCFHGFVDVFIDIRLTPTPTF